MKCNDTQVEKLDELIEKVNILIKNTNVKETMSINEAATYSGIGHETIRMLVNKKDSDFPYFRIGKKVIIKKTLLDEWLEKVSTEHRNI